MSAPREIRRMNEAQFKRARKLISHLCANCDGGNCLLLDDGEEHVCPQRISYSVLCRYFVAAVLPADRELFADIMDKDSRKRCADCGAPFVPTGSRAVYCPDCSARRERRRKASWARKKRGGRRRLGPLKALCHAALQRANRGRPTSHTKPPKTAV